MQSAIGHWTWKKEPEQAGSIVTDENAACACGSAPKLIFACSGAADVGALSDKDVQPGRSGRPG